MQNGGLQQLDVLEFVLVDLPKFSVLVNHVCLPCSLNLETAPFWLPVLPWSRQKLDVQAKKTKKPQEPNAVQALPTTEQRRDPAS